MSYRNFPIVGMGASDGRLEAFELELTFEKIGRKRMLLNAHRISHKDVPRDASRLTLSGFSSIVA
ncbi:MAG: hypothetical protein ABFD82_15155 [Syntrophaceae bacterium]